MDAKSTSYEQHWKNEINRCQREGLLRQPCPLRFLDATHGIDGNGRKLFVVCSNDYLGLRFHPEVIEAALASARDDGVGSSGARLITGSHPLAGELEKALANFEGYESTLVFSTGYMANIGLISSIVAADGVIFSDEKSHASLIDGCRLSKAKIVVYPHRDVERLRELLHEHRSASARFIVTDSVFSMDGTIAPVPNLLNLADEFDALLIIDDAHGFGVLGTCGRGVLEHFGIASRSRIIQVGSCSKSLGNLGGFVCGSELLIQYMRQNSRPFLCSTMSPTPILAASLKALQLLQSQPNRLNRLKNFSQITRDILREYNIPFPSDAVAIFPLVVGDEHLAVKISRDLYEQGVYLPAVRYPSVTAKSARLRVVLCSEYAEDEWQKTLHIIAKKLVEGEH